MEIEELLNKLEVFLCNENPYTIPLIFKDRQAIGELYDMLKELQAYRIEDGKDEINASLPNNQLIDGLRIGKATVRKKVLERECTTYDDALRHIERIFEEYNNQTFEHRKEGFPMIQFDCKKEQSDYGGMILNYNLEVRLRNQSK